MLMEVSRCQMPSQNLNPPHSSYARQHVVCRRSHCVHFSGALHLSFIPPLQDRMWTQTWAVVIIASHALPTDHNNIPPTCCTSSVWRDRTEENHTFVLVFGGGSADGDTVMHWHSPSCSRRLINWEQKSQRAQPPIYNDSQGLDPLSGECRD